MLVVVLLLIVVVVVVLTVVVVRDVLVVVATQLAQSGPQASSSWSHCASRHPAWHTPMASGSPPQLPAQER